MPKRKKDNKINMKGKAPNDQLTIILVNEYKGYNYMVQQVGKIKGNRRLFQYIIFDKEDNQFYQTYLTIKPDDKPITIGDVAKTAVVVQSMVKATVEELLKKKDPNYKGTKREEDEQKAAEEIVKILESQKDK